MSKQQNDDSITITVSLEGAGIHPAEISLIAAHLGELLQQVVREAATEE